VRTEIDIRYEDGHLLAVNKPAGALVVPTPAGERNTLTARLQQFFKQKGLPAGVYPCHRLDRETSGLIIYAKSKAAQEAMMEMFKTRAVHKTYLAFVHGCPGKKQAVIEHRLEGQSAQTRYRVLEAREGYSVVSVEPVTGRTNQIRIHFKMIGHPLVGDRKFSVVKNYPLKFRRTALHAAGIAFRHPVTGQPLSFEIEMPADMQQFIAHH